MAKKHKMNRGVVSSKHAKKEERKWPECIHFFDAHGNVFATLQRDGRYQGPAYYCINELNRLAELGGNAPDKYLYSITQEVIDALPEINAEIERMAKKR